MLSYLKQTNETSCLPLIYFHLCMLCMLY